MLIGKIENIDVLNWNEDITLQNAEIFKERMNDLIQMEASEKILSLQSVEYINSSGLGVIAESIIASRKIRKEIVISDIHETINEIFEIVHFGSFIKLFDTKEDALEFYRNDKAEE